MPAKTDNGPGPAEGGPGHNNPPNEEAKFLVHMRKIIAANADMAGARAERQRIRKLAKADGIELKKLDAVITMLDWAPGEVREHFGVLNRYALFAGLPIGAQADLFHDVPQAAMEELDWESVGFAAGMSDKGAYGTAPDECPPERHQAYLRGVHRATEKIAWSMAEAGVNPEKLGDTPASAVALEPEDEDEALDDAARKLKKAGFLKTEPQPEAVN